MLTKRGLFIASAKEFEVLNSIVGYKSASLANKLDFFYSLDKQDRLKIKDKHLTNPCLFVTFVG